MAEACGLKWSDLENNVLSIKRTVHIVKGKAVEGPTKEHRSMRNLTITDGLLKILNEHKDYQKKRCPDFSESFYICGGPDALRSSTIKHYLNLWENDAGLPHQTSHGFRHSYITTCVHNNNDVKVVADTAGNTPETVMKHYLHSDEAKNKVCMTSFQSSLLG